MGMAYVKVSPELRSRIYDESVRDSRVVYVLEDNPDGEGMHNLKVISNLLPLPGDNGCQDLILNEDGSFRFKKNQSEFWEC